MRRFLPLVLIAAIATALLATSACSKDATSTKTSFLDQANAICRDMKAKGAALTGPASTTKDPQAVPKLVDEMGQLVATTATQLRTLTPPSGDEATVSAAIDALAKTGHDATLVPAAGSKDQTSGSIAMATYTASQKASDAAMTAYGMTDCSIA